MFTHLVTHSGAFHADDLLATALLRVLAPNAPIERTRDIERIITLVQQGGIAYDVGQAYDHDQRIYDHHQVNPPCREEPMENVTIPYSSFGLIWKHYGALYLQAILPNETDETYISLAEKIDARFVSRIDMSDNAVFPESQQGLQHPMSLSRTLETFNIPFDAPIEDEFPAFLATVDIADKILRARVSAIASEHRSRSLSEKAIRERATSGDPRWVQLPFGMPYMGALKSLKATDVLYVLMPSRDHKEWNVTAVRDSKGEAGCVHPFPANWAGLRGDALAAVTGVEDAVFCHNGRFLAVAKSLQGAKRLLALALPKQN